jgi:hypothetical protein
MIVTSYNMSDLHIRIINYHSKVIGGRAITSHDNQIIQFGVLKYNFATNLIINYHTTS